MPLKGVSWMLVIQAALAARDHWGILTPSERTQLTRLLRQTRGRPANLSAREKQELRDLVGRLDLAGLGREMMPGGGKHRR